MRLSLVLVLCSLAGCGDGSSSADDAGVGVIDAAVAFDAGAADATDPGSDAAPPPRPCLDRSADLPRPPSGALPCDLLPPGLSLP